MEKDYKLFDRRNRTKLNNKSLKIVAVICQTMSYPTIVKTMLVLMPQMFNSRQCSKRTFLLFSIFTWCRQVRRIDQTRHRNNMVLLTITWESELKITYIENIKKTWFINIYINLECHSCYSMYYSFLHWSNLFYF